MGIPYINPTEIYSSLERITEDLRLPGGQIDTEYVATPSSRRAQNVMENDTWEGRNGSPDKCTMHLNDVLPKWLQDHMDQNQC